MKAFTILLSLLVFANVQAQTLDQSHTGSNNWYTCLTDGQITGQSFMAESSGVLSVIEIDLMINSCTYASQYQFTADILDGDGYVGAVLSSKLVTVSIPFGRGMLPIAFDNPTMVSIGHMYTIRLTPVAAQVCDSMMSMPMNICAQWLGSSSNSYTSGIPYLNGTQDNVYDKYFNTYVLTCGYVTDQSHTGVNNWYTCTTDGQIVGQSFVASRSGSLNDVKIDLNINSCTYTNDYQFTADIIEGEGFGGTILSTSLVTIPLPYPRSLLPIPFSNAPTLVGGEKYTIRITPAAHQVCDSMMSMPMYVCAQWMESSSDTYAGGVTYLNGTQNNAKDKYFTSTINTITSSSVNITACRNYTSPSGNNIWTNSSVYHDTIPNAAGCDSMMTINLTILPVDTNVSIVACHSYTSPSGNHTWTSSNTYTDTLLNISGCDSIITIDLSIGTNYSSVARSACSSFLSPSGNHTWTTAGIYNDTLINSSGCDSIITIDLAIESNTSFVSLTSCGNYTSPSGNHIWTSSSIYTDIIPNSAGCDSIITIDLTVESLNNSVIVNGTTIHSNETNATYQWIDCNNSNQPIPNQSSQNFTAPHDGDYAVVIFRNNCADTSACTSIMTLGLSNNNKENKILVYPNPANDHISVKVNSSLSGNRFTIADLSGRIVKRGELSSEISSIDISELVTGLYVINIGDKVQSQISIIK